MPSKGDYLSKQDSNAQSTVDPHSPEEDGKVLEMSLHPGNREEAIRYDTPYFHHNGIPSELVNKAQKLMLTVLESQSFAVGEQFEINALGLIDPNASFVDLDRQKDGTVYFGNQKESDGTKNDIVLDAAEQGLGNHHMVIKFNQDTMTYQVRDLGEGAGTFVKVIDPQPVRHGNIFSFGACHMVVLCDKARLPSSGADENLRQETEPSDSITLKFLSGPDQTFNFSSADSPVLIGRMADCQVRFEDSGISRYQSRISWWGNEWTIADGDGEKVSTNGTWYFADEYTNLENDCVLKIGQTLFSVMLTDSDRI